MPHTEGTRPDTGPGSAAAVPSQLGCRLPCRPCLGTGVQRRDGIDPPDPATEGISDAALGRATAIGLMAEHRGHRAEPGTAALPNLTPAPAVHPGCRPGGCAASAAARATRRQLASVFTPLTAGLAGCRRGSERRQRRARRRRGFDRAPSPDRFVLFQLPKAKLIFPEQEPAGSCRPCRGERAWHSRGDLPKPLASPTLGFWGGWGFFFLSPSAAGW